MTMTNRSLPVLHPGRAALLAFALALLLVTAIVVAGCGVTAHETVGRIGGAPVVEVQPVHALAPGVLLISTPRMDARQQRMGWTFRLLVPAWLDLPAWWTHEFCHGVLIAQGYLFETESLCEIAR